jgi:Undecaprenyl-phosphate galactose phosphotransferase WbaP
MKMTELVLDAPRPRTIVDARRNNAPLHRPHFVDLTSRSIAEDHRLQSGSPHWRTLLMAAFRKGLKVKRTCDLTLTLLGGVVCLPVIALVALAIKLSSRGPVFFGHERIGRYGHRFKALKFRTMVTNGDAVLAAHLAENPEARDQWRRDHKLKHDPRITPIGRILRKTSLDELPQLWNVLRGEMSLIGPRPIVHEEISNYGDDFDVYLQALPGITGLWQVSGRNDISYRQRVSLDVEYVVTWSIWLDALILLRTAFVVVCQRGAY